MSTYSFLASNCPLPEIDLTGAVRMKYAEYKKWGVQSSKESVLEQLETKDDHLEVLILDSSKMDHLNIGFCTNPPYGLEDYIKKHYIYWLEGDQNNETWRKQLYEYVKGVATNSGGLEIWSILFGAGLQSIDIMELKLSGLQLSDLEVMQSDRMNYCVKFK